MKTAEEILKEHDPESTFEPLLIYQAMEHYKSQSIRSALEPSLQKAIGDLLNKHCRENISNTQDFILAEYLMNCLLAYERAIVERNRTQTPVALE